jgi:hypothetical protein
LLWWSFEAVLRFGFGQLCIGFHYLVVRLPTRQFKVIKQLTYVHHVSFCFFSFDIHVFGGIHKIAYIYHGCFVKVGTAVTAVGA